ncbi:hypothetical protein BIV57_13425 [Mangrovactinospora gilvigrisea]|uniref:Methyltransferase n=1 Tax=Mangrovactinospora gilvigrisea TaxID=1428644 RepID=A0A1J7BE71_9ACTN|nr:hypothetical protein [Mangrovactinospora gilvigrisea]OIV36983.1 hypothetical protein BIV57_13425 [Mangrovactinospora gilvigrisea]
MANKLTKDLERRHAAACDLIASDKPLDREEQEQVLTDFQASSTARNGLDGAFFTPLGLANDLALHVSGDRIIDLCAGIGALAWSCQDAWGRRSLGRAPREFVCVERNPAYVEVGRRILPEAQWICGDVLDLVDRTDLGPFDTAIANPPFGPIPRIRDAPGCSSRRFEYHAIATASRLARRGVFVSPQQSAPFRYSGRHRFLQERDRDCERFEHSTGIRMNHNCGIDTTAYRDDWQGVSPAVEVVVCNFDRQACDAR